MSAMRSFLRFIRFDLSGSLCVRGCLSVAICAVTLLTGCAGPEKKVTQFGTLDGLMTGEFDGTVSCSEIRKHGDLGLGTFDRLDGEMVVVDGKIFQVTSDGVVRRAPGSLTSPFAAVTQFEAERIAVTRSTLLLPQLEATLDRLCPDPDRIYSIRIRGEFPALTVRSVPAQQKPYRGLVEVIKDQTIFHTGPIRGTLVGFRFPAKFKGINAAGTHLHFLSDDKKVGGHVLGVTSGVGAQIEVAAAKRFELFFSEGRPICATASVCGL